MQESNLLACGISMVPPIERGEVREPRSVSFGSNTECRTDGISPRTSGWWESNPRQSAWKANALPLSYTREMVLPEGFEPYVLRLRTGCPWPARRREQMERVGLEPTVSRLPALRFPS